VPHNILQTYLINERKTNYINIKTNILGNPQHAITQQCKYKGKSKIKCNILGNPQHAITQHCKYKDKSKIKCNFIIKFDRITTVVTGIFLCSHPTLHCIWSNGSIRIKYFGLGLKPFMYCFFP